MTAYVGRAFRRREDRKFLTGKGRYVDDIKVPGTLQLACGDLKIGLKSFRENGLGLARFTGR